MRGILGEFFTYSRFHFNSKLHVDIASLIHWMMLPLHSPFHSRKKLFALTEQSGELKVMAI